MIVNVCSSVTIIVLAISLSMLSGTGMHSLARDQLSLVCSIRNEELLIIHRGVVNYTHIISKTKKKKKKKNRCNHYLIIGI